MSGIQKLKPNYLHAGDPGYVEPYTTFSDDQEICFDDTYGQYCTRAVGHAGDHVSHGPEGEMIAIWPVVPA